STGVNASWSRLFSDLSDLHDPEPRMRHRVHHDPLTGSARRRDAARSVSVGAAVYPSDGTTWEASLQVANEAMNHQKGPAKVRVAGPNVD
ncbi:MAG: hypothetical protein ACOCPR_03665, partial [Guyparkeria sp.]